MAASRLQTVSCQLAPLLPTKAGHTPRARPGPRARPQGRLYPPLLTGCAPNPAPALSAIVLLYRLTWDRVTVPSPEVRPQLHFQPSSDLPANWLRCKPSQQGRDFEVTALCGAPGTPLSACQIPAAGLLLRPLRRRPGHHAALPGARVRCCVVAGRSLILQAGPGMQPDLLLISGGRTSVPECASGMGTPDVPSLHWEPPQL